MKTGPKPRPLADRFWPKVEKTDDCWLWRGALTSAGYGKILASDGYLALAHRVSWSLVKGPIPRSLQVLHECDNPACVRPEHLFLGTQGDNMADMWHKGRQGHRGPREKGAVTRRRHTKKIAIAKGPSRGEDRWSAKLTEVKVAEIRARYAAGGVTQRVLAAEYGVRQGQISRIVNGTRWQ